MNTIENNKIIAEFMGYKVDTDLYGGIPVNGMKTITSTSDCLKFHKDWNWLMEVVEKIETLTDFNNSPEFFIMYDNREEFKGWYWSIEVPKKFSKECSKDNSREGTKIEAVYNACVEFIKWYNEQKN